MSEEKKNLTNLTDEAVDGEKIKGGNGPMGPIVPDFDAPLPGEPTPEGPHPTDGPITPDDGPLPGEHTPPGDDGLINPHPPKL